MFINKKQIKNSLNKREISRNFFINFGKIIKINFRVVTAHKTVEYHDIFDNQNVDNSKFKETVYLLFKLYRLIKKLTYLFFANLHFLFSHFSSFSF